MDRHRQKKSASFQVADEVCSLDAQVWPRFGWIPEVFYGYWM